MGVIRGHLALGKEVPQLNLAKTFEEIYYKPKVLLSLSQLILVKEFLLADLMQQ